MPEPRPCLRCISHGGGRQTTALLVLQAQGRIDYPLFLFANVGDQAENPDTLAYHREIAVPFAAEHDIELVELRWVDRSGRTRDLYEDLLRQDKSLKIPLRDSGGFGIRACTPRYKIEVVARELARRGATADAQAVVGLGISTDEIGRATTVPPKQPWTTRAYPLLDLGLSLRDCIRIITDAGLPCPPKSSCSFCPFQGRPQWRKQRRERPDLWARNVALDAMLSERHVRLRGDRAGLASATLPLDLAVDDQLDLFGSDCDSGSCMT